MVVILSSLLSIIQFSTPFRSKDKIHGKSVYSIRGSINAKNFISIPTNSAGHSLGLTGNYLYLQIRILNRENQLQQVKKMTQEQTLDEDSSESMEYFVFHVDVLTRDNLTIRISFGNLYRHINVQINSVSIPIGNLIRGDRWTVFALDFGKILENFYSRSYMMLKGITMCSNMVFRNAYTSDIVYNQNTLARDMFLPVPKGEKWDNVYDWYWFPEQPILTLSERVYHSPRDPLPYVPIIPTQPSLLLDDDALSTYLVISKDCELGSRSFQDDQRHHKHEHALQGQHRQYNDAEEIYTTVEHNISHERKQREKREQHRLYPEPVLECTRVIGFSGQKASNITWVPNRNEVMFSCFNWIILMNVETRSQRILRGHTDQVCGIAVDGKGILMASAQQGPDSLIRIWNINTGLTIGFLKDHDRDLCCLDISHNGNSVVAVGIDQNARHKVVVWDISRIMDTGRAMVIVSKSTVYHIRRIRFVPYEDSRMVSCGKDNIRFWRVNKGLLRDVSVDTSADDRNDLVRQNFLDLSFEKAFLGTNTPDGHRLYVSTQSGAVYDISYKKRIIEYVFQVHSSAIHTIDVNEGMCVTGSDDKIMRVWPLDFADYFLEAEHESPVRSVSLSNDGLKIAVGSQNGALGTLDLTNQNYTTIIRSHTDRILMLALDARRKQFTTISADQTIRVWDMDTLDQLFQFDTIGESPICVAHHPVEHWIACGFDSGVVRIFDIPSTTVLHEYRAHRTAVRHLLYTADSRWLISAAADSLCVVDCDHMYQPVRVMHYVHQSESVSIALSPDNSLIASVGPAGNVVHLFGTTNFMEKHTFETASSDNFTAVRFSMDSKEIVAITSDDRIMRINISTGKVERELVNSRAKGMSCLDVSGNGMLFITGSRDGSLCIWDASLKSAFGTQTFSGHSSRVNQVLHCQELQKVLSVGDDAIFVWDLKEITQGDQSTEPDNINSIAQEKRHEGVSVQQVVEVTNAGANGLQGANEASQRSP